MRSLRPVPAFERPLSLWTHRGLHVVVVLRGKEVFSQGVPVHLPKQGPNTGGGYRCLRHPGVRDCSCSSVPQPTAQRPLRAPHRSAARTAASTWVLIWVKVTSQS